MTQSQPTSHKGLDRKTTFILVSIAVLLIGLFVGLFLVQQSQSPEKRAQEPGPSCPLDGFRCTWDTEVGVTYDCTISELTESGKKDVAHPTVQTDSATGKGLCTYTPEANKRYECTVHAIKEPGCETTASGQASCPAIPPTETPVPTATETPSPTPTPNPACYDRTCTGPEDTTSCADMPGNSCVDTDLGAGTDYRCVTNPLCTNPSEDNPKSCWCYAPTPTPSNTPTPTLTPTPTHTPTPSPTKTPTPTPGASSTPTLTPSPTLTGAPTATNTPTSSRTPTPPPGSTATPTTRITDIVVANVTNTPAPTNVLAQSSPTTAPTLPVAGGVPQITIAFLFIGIVAIGVALAL